MESMTRPAHRRKLSNGSGMLSSFSSKSAYDDVFAAPPALRRFIPPAPLEDYSEIFGGGSRGSSIPVLDLSALDERTEEFRSSKLDYANIFGGFADDVLAVPYEELFSAAFTNSKCSNNKARNQTEEDSPLKGADTYTLSEDDKGLPSKESDRSLDASKRYMSYPNTSQRSKDPPHGTTHVTKLHAVPGFTYFVDETSSEQKTELDGPVPPIKSKVSRTWSFSGDIHDENKNRKTEVPMSKKPAAEGVVRAKRGSWWDGLQSNNRSFHAGETYQKSHSFKNTSFPSPPMRPHDSRGHIKQSKSSNISSKANTFGKTTGNCSDGSSDEELDITSDAAACAAALRRAVEKAQESIRLAKELRERGGNDGLQGVIKQSFEGISKFKDRKKNMVDEDANIIEKHAEDRHERCDSLFHELTDRTTRVTSRSAGIPTPPEYSLKLSTSRAAEVEKPQGDVAEFDGNARRFLDLVDCENCRTSTVASEQIDNEKTTIFSSKNKQECGVDKMTTTVESLEQIENTVEETTLIEKGFGMSLAENELSVDQQAEVSEEHCNISNSAVVDEYETTVNLEITLEDTRAKDNQDTSCEQGEFRNELQECLDVSEEEISEPSIIETEQILKESQNLAKEKEQFEGFHQEKLEREAENVLAQEEKDNGLGNSFDGETMIPEPKFQFVEIDDKAEASGSGIQESLPKDSQDGEVRETSEAIQDRGVDEMELIYAHKAEETQEVSEDEFDEEVVEDLIHVPDGEKSEIVKKEHEEEDQKVLEQKICGEGYDWEEVAKRIKEACVNEDEMVGSESDEISESQNVEMFQQSEEATGVHFDGDTNEEMDFLQEASYKEKSDTFDAFSCTSLHEVHEASIAGAGDHEAGNLTSGANEAFYNCEWEVNKGEETDKTCKLEDRNLVETGDFVQNPDQEHVRSTDFMDVASKGDKANADHNGMNFEHKISQENAPEISDVVQNAGKKIDISVKMQNVSEAYSCDENAGDIGFPEDNIGTVIEEDLQETEPSVNPESGGGVLHRSRENAQHIEAEIVFNNENGEFDTKLVHKENNMVEELVEEEFIAVAKSGAANKMSEETCKEMGTRQNIQFTERYSQKFVLPEGKETSQNSQKEVKQKDHSRKTEAIKEREREKDRIAVERAIREARERAFAEARERAERAAVERAAAEVRQRVMAEARKNLEKATSVTKLADKASNEAKQRAERAAVERATAEARERALEKALSQNSSAQERVQVDGLSCAARDSALKPSSSSSDLERSNGSTNESAQRRKARLERHHRIMERAAKALEEKNMRDLHAQKEQAERNRLAESVDADIKRWASGKEGNLRALLSTLQYILGPDSGWQPISLTEIITTAAVRKAYRKATLYVHPDKLQQRGASIQQKYICEKVFDLLKAAWNRFISEER